MAPRRAVDRLNSLHISNIAAQQQERKFSSAQSAINAFAKAAAAADTATDVAEELPSAYNEAIDHLLRGDNPPLATLTDGEVSTIAEQILQNIYDNKTEWEEAGKWAEDEAKLYKLSGVAAQGSIAAGKLVLCSSIIDYLRTFIEAMEYKGGGKEPELLTKKRHVKMNTVYGPVNVSSTLPGNTFEVWVSSSEVEEEKKDEDADCINDSGEDGKIAVVLGAGNQSMLTIIDVLDNTLRHRRPVVVKHHPLRPWLAAPYEIILKPLIKRGYVSQCKDFSVQVTKALLSHPAVNHVHITGAFSTAKAVEETLQKANPSLTETKIKSMVSSELGCATPCIVDDGDYTDAELTHAARIIACGKKTNCGSNCLSPQVVVFPKNWKQKDSFREKLFEELKRQPTTPCYYPGSVHRKNMLVEECKSFGSACTTIAASSVSEGTCVSEDDQVVVVECGTPGEEGYNSQPLLREIFGPLLGIVELDSEEYESEDYLSKVAVPFLNNKDNIFGSLSCTLFIPKSKGYGGERLQGVLANLNYGTIAINQMTLFGYTTATKGGAWGGHALEMIGQSGNGNIGDLFGVIGTNPAKVVVYGPSLESKPLLDNSNPPPPIVLDIVREFICTDSMLKGIGNAFFIIFTRSVRVALSYMPIVGRFVGDRGM
jgi:acyl-CoA reductase-like NAD-dependent aldehyde dehydrogenase